MNPLVFWTQAKEKNIKMAQEAQIDQEDPITANGDQETKDIPNGEKSAEQNEPRSKNQAENGLLIQSTMEIEPRPTEAPFDSLDSFKKAKTEPILLRKRTSEEEASHSNGPVLDGNECSLPTSPMKGSTRMDLHQEGENREKRVHL